MSLKTALVILGIAALASAGPLKVDEEPQLLECVVSGETLCVLQKVKVTRNQPRIQIQAPEPEKITAIKFVESTVEVLTEDICEVFPNLESIDASGVKLEEIEEDAFVQCGHLSNLDVSSNHLEFLEHDVFLPLENLKYLHLQSNRLTELHRHHLRSLKNLLFLYAYDNHLSYFPAFALAPVPELLVLSVHTNELSDINARDLLTNLPNLMLIEFNNNPISCARVGDILENFSKGNVFVFPESYNRDRFYDTEVVNGIKCLDDVQWTGAHYRRNYFVPDGEHQLVDNKVDTVLEEVHELEAEISKLEKVLEAKQL